MERPTDPAPTDDVLRRRSRRSLRVRLLVLLGTVVLGGFALWAATQLVRARSLHLELDGIFSWLEEKRDAQEALESWRRGPPDDAAVTLEQLDALGTAAGRLARASGDPEMQIAARRLTDILPALTERVAAGDPDALWRDASSALAALDTLEEHAEGRVAVLHAGWAGHWSAMLWVGLGALLLCAANGALLLHLRRRRRQLAVLRAELERQARHDALTGLWNREAILRLLSHELIRAQRSETPLGVVLLDVEGFAEINTRFGQDQGDDILRQISERMQTLVRPYDTMGRFGGDDFLVVLPNCDETATEAVAQRLLRTVHGHEMEHAHGTVRVAVRAATLCLRQPGEITVDRLLIKLEDTMRAAREGEPMR